MCRVWAMRSAGSIRCSVTRWTALAARGSGATEAVYVHAKIGIIDDRWLTLGSANLKRASPFNEERVNLIIDGAALATATHYRLWAEHLELHAVVGDPAKLVDESWWPTASQQLARRQAGAPLTHRPSCCPASRTAHAA